MGKPLAKSLQLKELLETEQTYFKSLDALKKTLTFARGHYSALLASTIEPLHQTSLNIINNIEQTIYLLERDEAKKSLPEDNKLRFILGINRVSFVKDFFEQLKQYSSLFVEINSVQKESPDLLSQLDERIKKTNDVNLGSLLILPIQRGPRYVLLLQQIKAFMVENPDSADERQKEMVTSLLESVQEQLQQVNHDTPESKCIKKPYQFGDHTKAILGIPSYPPEVVLPDNKTDIDIESFHVVEIEKKDNQQKTDTTRVEPNPTRGYRFGDITRYLLWGSSNKALSGEDTPSPSSAQETMK